MSWFGGFFTGVSMSINAAFCLVIDKLARERDDLKKKLKSNECYGNAQYRSGYAAGQKENIQDIFNSIMNHLHIEDGVEDTKKYVSNVLNDMTKEQLEVVALLVAQAFKENPKPTSKNTIIVDLDDVVNNGPGKIIDAFEAMSTDDNPLNVNITVMVGGSKLMDVNETFNFNKDPETLSKFNNLLDSFLNSDPNEIVNRWKEGILINESDITNQQNNDILVNEPTGENDSDTNDQSLEMM